MKLLLDIDLDILNVYVEEDENAIYQHQLTT